MLQHRQRAWAVQLVPLPEALQIGGDREVGHGDGGMLLPRAPHDPGLAETVQRQQSLLAASDLGEAVLCQ
jgi:hypothetical protein